METNFTKGKWTVNKHNNVYSKYKLPIAVTYDGSTAHNSFRESNVHICKANALLISKAPEMFEMLIKAERTLREVYDCDTTELKQLLKEATEL